MFQRILFATDFSLHAEVAQKIAASLATGDGKRLWALTVLEPEEEPLAMSDEPPEVSSEKWEALLAKRRQTLESEKATRLEESVQSLEAAGVSITKMVREGDPASEILAAAREVNADLIVMGSHSLRNMWDVALGSTTAKVAEEALCPVLIVPSRPANFATQMKRILFATDFSAHALAAQKVVISVAKERDSHVWAVHVVKSAAEKAEADAALAELVRELNDLGIAADKLVRTGRPAKEIAKAAIDVEADLIILGSHSQRGIRDVLLGNVAEGVTHMASCPAPVLLVSIHP